MAAHQAPLSLGFSRQEHWSGLPFPSPMHESEKWTWSRSVVCNPQRPHGLQPTRLLLPWDFPGKSTGVGCRCLLCLYLLGIFQISTEKSDALRNTKGFRSSLMFLDGPYMFRPLLLQNCYFIYFYELELSKVKIKENDELRRNPSWFSSHKSVEENDGKVEIVMCCSCVPLL